MDLDQLHTFLEIVRLKSFSKAAQSCYRTQPAVSAQVRQLEQEMNAPLFARLGTKIALTPAGDIFARYAEQSEVVRKELLFGEIVNRGYQLALCQIPRGPENNHSARIRLVAAAVWPARAYEGNRLGSLHDFFTA